MKKILLLLIFAAATLNPYAQSLKAKKYNYWVNQAELAICDSNYQKASDCYDKAFQYKAPFGGDASFAFKLNYKYLNNIPRACQCFHYMAQMGDKPEWVIDDTVRYADVWNQIKLIADTTKCTVNRELENALVSILKSDQYVRMHSELYDSDEAWGKAVTETDSANLKALMALYQAYPAINEYTAGMSPASPALYIHFRRSFLFDPKNILYNEVLKGNVRANNYAKTEDACMFSIIQDKDSHETDKYGTSTHHIFCVDSIGFIIQPENLKQINKNRKKILMAETWEDYAKKAHYVYCNETDFYFVPISNIYYMPDEAEEIIKNTISKIDNGIIKGSYFVLPPNKR